MNPHPPEQPEFETDASAAPLTDAESAEVEAALRALALAEPSASLDARVAEALRSAPADATPALALTDTTPTRTDADAPLALAEHNRRSGWMTWLTVAAVLALLAALGLSVFLPRNATQVGPDLVDNRPGPTDSPDTRTETADPNPALTNASHRFSEQPVELRWSRDLDQGLLTSATGQPVRAIRRQDVEQRVWVDTERGITVQITRPTERLVVVKQPTF